MIHTKEKNLYCFLKISSRLQKLKIRLKISIKYYFFTVFPYLFALSKQYGFSNTLT